MARQLPFAKHVTCYEIHRYEKKRVMMFWSGQSEGGRRLQSLDGQPSIPGSIIIYHVAVTSLSHGSRSHAFHVYASPLMQYSVLSHPYHTPFAYLRGQGPTMPVPQTWL